MSKKPTHALPLVISLATIPLSLAAIVAHLFGASEHAAS